MRFGFVAKHRAIWPVSWICEALGVSRSGFHAWLNRSPSKQAHDDEVLLAGIRSSFAGSDRTYGARRVWHDVLADGLDVGLHRIERLMRQEGLRARPRRRGLPKDAIWKFRFQVMGREKNDEAALIAAWSVMKPPVVIWPDG